MLPAMARSSTCAATYCIDYTFARQAVCIACAGLALPTDGDCLRFKRAVPLGAMQGFYVVGLGVVRRIKSVSGVAVHLCIIIFEGAGGRASAERRIMLPLRGDAAIAGCVVLRRRDTP